MKRFICVILMFVSLSAWALSLQGSHPNRMADDAPQHNGIFSFNLSNYATISDMKYLENNSLLYRGTIWVSGKKSRKDDQGNQLYWLHYPPQNSTDYVTADHHLWNPGLVAVIDSLTSAGADGDRDLYELLPAYNPLNENELASIVPNAQYYSENDRVLESIFGTPAPIPFDPFNSETFCFSIPQDGNFETPGFLTQSAYFYDYCPFGVEGDRDWGASNNASSHYPLGLAIHQESYSWPIQNYHNILVQKHSIYNCNEDDSIEDLAISHYFDADIGPATLVSGIAADDKSGFVKGDGYEFAYSRDAEDGSYEIPYHIASKVYIPNLPYINNQAWYWRVGSGPDDTDVHDHFPSLITSNEKYWLATGSNPDPSKFAPLRPLSDEVYEYEQPTPNDTRVLNTMYGAQPGTPEYDATDSQGNYLNRLSLAAHESIEFYVIYFVGTSIDELKTQSLAIEDFIDTAFYVDPDADLTAIPYLNTIENQAPDTFVLNWFSMINPHHFEVTWKEYGQPATQWNIIELPPESRSYNLSGMNPTTYYEIKIAAVYYSPEEVYLESRTALANLSYIAVEDEQITSVPKLNNYPNPFSGSTKIMLELEKSAPVKLDIYNIKGQKVRSLADEVYTGRIHTIDWDAKDDHGRACSSGVYYLRVISGGMSSKHKMLLIK